MVVVAFGRCASVRARRESKAEGGPEWVVKISNARVLKCLGQRMNAGSIKQAGSGAEASWWLAGSAEERCHGCSYSRVEMVVTARFSPERTPA